MMKKTILTSVASAALLLPLVTACSEEETFVGENTGRMTLEVDFKSDPVSSAPESRATVENPITVDDLSLRLTSLEAEFSKTWTPISEFDPATEFPVGTYKLEAFYGDAKEEGYGKPHYNGEQEVKVVTGKTTPVSLTVQLANSIVKVVYTDAFKDYMTAYSATVRTSLGGEIAYDEANAEELYVAPGTVSLALDITKPNGKQGQVVAATFEAKPRYRHTVTVDYNGGEVGKLEGLTITFDETLGSEEYTIDISDDILSASAPTLTPDGFTSGETVTLVETTATPKDLKVNIVARGKIGSVTLTSASASLAKKGWPENVDLAKCDQATQDKLKELGLNVLGLWKNPDEMAVIDFTKVLSAIPYEEGADNTSVFTVNVTDLYNKTCEPVTFKVSVEKLDMQLLQGSIIADGKLTLLMKYNGGDVENVKFQAKNSRGTYTELIVNKITPNEASSTFEIELTHPANDAVIKAENTLEVMAVKGDLTSEIVAKSPVMIADEAATNAFAKRALLGVKFTDDAVMAQSANVEWYLSTDNGSTYNKATSAAKKPAGRAVVGSKTYELTGLQPSTTYMAYAKLGEDQTFPVEFTTEAAAQLPNAGMENWEKTASGKNWERWDVKDWATYNIMTTSNTGTRNETAYVNRSGTAQSTDKHNGSYAAELRTIGWGSGNSAVGGISGSNPKYITKGMLYLGGSPVEFSSLDAQATKGIDFSTRPSGVTFWYKYAPKNGADYGGAKAWVKDAAGNVIAEGSISQLNSKDYVQATINLEYPATCGKAATIYVEFASSDHPEWNTRSKDWFKVPSFGNLSDGVFQGSSLFVDDIELIY